MKQAHPTTFQYPWLSVLALLGFYGPYRAVDCRFLPEKRGGSGTTRKKGATSMALVGR